MWPEKFIKQIQAHLNEEAGLFFESLQEDPPTSIRTNPHKPITIPSTWEPVPWHPEGYYLSERPRFVMDPLFHSGAYYVQEASSMILYQIISELQLEKFPLLALDICAAPGGKSTQLASALHSESFILCNETHSKRYNILKENVEKWGSPNLYTCSHDPKRFKRLAGLFDLLLVDAPCSGEGLFRKDENATSHWSEAQIMFCAGRQKRILSDALPLVKKNGIIIYSTCTYNQEENIKNAAWITKQGFESVSIPMLEKFGFKEISDGKAIGYQAFPHIVKGEGFFVSIFQSQVETRPAIKKVKNHAFSWKKEKSNIPPLQKDVQASLYRNEKNVLASFPFHHVEIMKILSPEVHIHPIEIGRMKSKGFVPAQGLAVSNHLNASLVNVKSLSKKQAIQFLRKEAINGLDFDQGWQWITYQDLGLGWIKGIGNRYNNYFPSHLRIRTKA